MSYKGILHDNRNTSFTYMLVFASASVLLSSFRMLKSAYSIKLNILRDWFDQNFFIAMLCLNINYFPASITQQYIAEIND